VMYESGSNHSFEPFICASEAPKLSNGVRK